MSGDHITGIICASALLSVISLLILAAHGVRILEAIDRVVNRRHKRKMVALFNERAKITQDNNWLNGNEEHLAGLDEDKTK
tara:strand:+ start:2506 stop:2748 length:243 start_codon:yes stop_codon:yes gene_type:complete